MLLNLKFILKNPDSLFKKLSKVSKTKELSSHQSEKENPLSKKEDLQLKKSSHPPLRQKRPSNKKEHPESKKKHLKLLKSQSLRNPQTKADHEQRKNLQQKKKK